MNKVCIEHVQKMVHPIFLNTQKSNMFSSLICSFFLNQRNENKHQSKYNSMKCREYNICEKYKNVH